MREEQFHRAVADWSAPLPHPRMRIYRNNVSAALVNALQVRFPVTGQLVGREFFFAMAREYADANRPQSAVLIDYGAEFPGFIRGFGPATSVPYVGDVAALENLWWRAYHAAEAEPLTAGALSGVAPGEWGGLRFTFHPSAGLLQSAHATGTVWLAHHGGPAMGTFDTAMPECVLVSRPKADVRLRIIPRSSHFFLDALMHGQSLAAAVEETLQHHPDFDIKAQVQGLLPLNILQGYSP